MVIHIAFEDTPLSQAVPLEVLVKKLDEERRQRIIRDALIAFELGEVDTQQQTQYETH